MNHSDIYCSFDKVAFTALPTDLENIFSEMVCPMSLCPLWKKQRVGCSHNTRRKYKNISSRKKAARTATVRL